MEILGILLILLVILCVVLFVGVIIDAIALLLQYAILFILIVSVPVAITTGLFYTYMKMREEDFEIWRSVLIPLFSVIAGASNGFLICVAIFNMREVYNYTLLGIRILFIIDIGWIVGCGATLASFAYPFAREKLILYQQKRNTQHLIKGD